MGRKHTAAKAKRSICKTVANGKISMRKVAAKKNISASTVSNWMSHFKDGSSLERKQRSPKYKSIVVSDYLDTVAVSDAIVELGTLMTTPDEEVKYKGVPVPGMTKDICMHLII